MFRPEARVGTVVKRYRLAQVLSSGGMGSLYKATHLRTGRDVAIKFLLDLDDTARFQVEARATVELKHPNVVDVLDMDETEDGVPFLVMELLHGDTLAGELQQAGRLTPVQCLTWLVPVMGAVAMAHSRGILHRDIKPENIFLARAADGRVTPKLLDFGVAKTRTMPTITRSGAIVGTPAYMSPEQALAEQELTPATDVWSMGVVLFECCAGIRPFLGESATSVLLKVVRDPAPSLEAACPDLPLPWNRAVDRGLQRSAALRPRNMGEYARRLLLGAMEARLPLPADPDPLGLPEWRAWSQAGGSATVSLDASREELGLAESGPLRTAGAPRSSATPRPEESAPTLQAAAAALHGAAPTPRDVALDTGALRRGVRKDVVALILGVALAVAAWLWLESREPVAAPVEPSVAPQQRKAEPAPPAEPVTLKPVEPAPVEPPPVAPPPAAAVEPEPKKSRSKSKKSAPRNPDTAVSDAPEPPVAAPPRPEPKPGNQLPGIEPDWR